MSQDILVNKLSNGDDEIFQTLFKIISCFFEYGDFKSDILFCWTLYCGLSTGRYFGR